MYGVYERGTNKLIKQCKTIKSARLVQDRLDLKYGCYHYYINSL